MSILTMSIIAVILVIMLVIAILISNEGWKTTLFMISITGLIFLCFVGFGLHATSGNEYVVVEKMYPTDVEKSKIKVYVEIDGTTLTYTDKESYDIINDSTVFYKETYYNYYGFKNGNEYKIKTEFKEFDKKIKL